jgi:hypothetical protein
MLLNFSAALRCAKMRSRLALSPGEVPETQMSIQTFGGRGETMATEKPPRRSDFVVQRPERLDAVEAARCELPPGAETRGRCRVPSRGAERQQGANLVSARRPIARRLRPFAANLARRSGGRRSALRGCPAACRIHLFPQAVSARRNPRRRIPRGIDLKRRIGLFRVQDAGREVSRYLFDVHAPSAIPFPGPVHRA